MKKLNLFIALLLCLACGEATDKKNNENSNSENTDDVATNQASQSADYSSLLTSYQCDMTVAEIANVLGVNEADVTTTDISRNGWCTFQIKGFGTNALGDDTFLEWGLDPSDNVSIDKEIKSYQEAQANNIVGMGIQRSETGDCYIATSPLYGRVIILNENYNKLFFFNYAVKRTYKTRTDEQHAQLGEKMIVLANYLLQKHKR
jgi:hypothetical protein